MGRTIYQLRRDLHVIGLLDMALLGVMFVVPIVRLAWFLVYQPLYNGLILMGIRGELTKEVLETLNIHSIHTVSPTEEVCSHESTLFFISMTIWVCFTVANVCLLFATKDGMETAFKTKSNLLSAYLFIMTGIVGAHFILSFFDLSPSVLTLGPPVKASFLDFICKEAWFWFYYGYRICVIILAGSYKALILTLEAAMNKAAEKRVAEKEKKMAETA